MSFSHGECECRDGCGCATSPGPAAFVVARGGRDLMVCTKCDLSRDTNKRLLVTREDDLAPFWDFDALGAVCISWDLNNDSLPRAATGATS